MATKSEPEQLEAVATNNCTGTANVIPSPKQVNPNSFNVIYEALHSFSSEWYNIGSKLMVDHILLSKIRNDHPGDSELCLQKTLEHLFRRDCPPTMNDVIEALESPLIDNKCLAKQLKDKFTINT